MSAIKQAQANSFFEFGAFFLLELPQGSSFGIDTQEFQVRHFDGVKLLPPGFHLFTATAIAGKFANDNEIAASAIGVKHSIIRFVRPQEVISREWSNFSESFQDADTVREGSSRSKRRKLPPAEPENTAVSRDHLRSIDTTMAPYSFDQLPTWKALTQHVDEVCVGRVVGFDDNGDARLDALTDVAGDEQHIPTSSQSVWGKQRHDFDMSDVVQADTETTEEDLLRFVNFSLKRSWRAGAVGEEITRNSKDKSWLLGNVIATQLNHDYRQLLAELSLAFILFAIANNFGALVAYQRILSLVCRSSTAVFDGHLNMVQELLGETLVAQLRYLPPEVFEEMPDFETFYLAELSALQTALRIGIKSAGKESTEFADLAGSWASLHAVTSQRFGWDLNQLELPLSVERIQSGVTRYDLLQDAGDDEEEDEEDKPVVVVLEDESLIPRQDATEPFQPPSGQDSELPSRAQRTAALRAQLNLDDDSEEQVIRL